MEDQILTTHFKLSEFSRSTTAEALKIDNTIPEELIPNIKALCENILEPLREHAGKPIIISSGYRCPKLNRTVGGVPNSKHQTGEAADIYNPDAKELREWYLWAKASLPCHQILWEQKGNTKWIHVSYVGEAIRGFEGCESGTVGVL